MIKRFFLIIFLSCLCYNCASKSAATAKELADLKNAVSNQSFKFVANSANPVAFANVTGIQNLLPPGSNQASINMVNNPNFLIIKKDSVFLDMPYYGEQQIAMAYDSNNSGLSFTGLAEAKKINYAEKKQKFTLQYDVKGEREGLKLILVLFPNKTARLDVNSSHRTSIYYYGNWKLWDENK